MDETQGWNEGGTRGVRDQNKKNRIKKIFNGDQKIER